MVIAYLLDLPLEQCHITSVTMTMVAASIMRLFLVFIAIITTAFMVYHCLLLSDLHLIEFYFTFEFINQILLNLYYQQASTKVAKFIITIVILSTIATIATITANTNTLEFLMESIKELQIVVKMITIIITVTVAIIIAPLVNVAVLVVVAATATACVLKDVEDLLIDSAIVVIIKIGGMLSIAIAAIMDLSEIA